MRMQKGMHGHGLHVFLFTCCFDCALAARDQRYASVMEMREGESASATVTGEASEDSQAESLDLAGTSTNASKYHASCYGNVGSGTCGQSKDEGQCMCPDGCMGADGNCYPTKNKAVATGFTLKNLKWPDLRVYVQRLSVFDQLKTTSSSINFGQDKFDLYELPGHFEGKRMFFLSSHKWPDYVVSLQATAGTALSLWGTYAVGLASHHQPWGLRDMMLQVCSLKSHGHPEAVKIGTSVPVGGSSIWAYIKKGSYFLYGYWYPERVVIQKIEQKLGPEENIPNPEVDTPGTGGFWVPDPPIPDGVLPDC